MWIKCNGLSTARGLREDVSPASSVTATPAARETRDPWRLFRRTDLVFQNSPVSRPDPATCQTSAVSLAFLEAFDQGLGRKGTGHRGGTHRPARSGCGTRDRCAGSPRPGGACATTCRAPQHRCSEFFVCFYRSGSEHLCGPSPACPLVHDGTTGTARPRVAPGRWESV